MHLKYLLSILIIIALIILFPGCGQNITVQVWNCFPVFDEQKFITDFHITDVSITNNNFESFPYMIGGIDSLKAKVLRLVDINQLYMDGEVIAAFNVNEDGTVGNIEIEKIQKQKIYFIGNKADMNKLDEIKIEEIIAEVIKTTDFVPAYKKEQPVKSFYRITFYFYTHKAHVN